MLNSRNLMLSIAASSLTASAYHAAFCFEDMPRPPRYSKKSYRDSFADRARSPRFKRTRSGVYKLRRKP
jgi:hypothetical protein